MASTDSREKQIAVKHGAVKRAIQASNSKASKKAKDSIKKKGTASYKEQYLKGSKQGFTKSDYGVGKGAAIPYQVGTNTAKVSKGIKTRPKPVDRGWDKPPKFPPGKPKPMPRPTPRSGAVFRALTKSISPGKRRQEV